MSWQGVALRMPAARSDRTGWHRQAPRFCGAAPLIPAAWSIKGLRALTGWGGR
jgi:hypothetical protein